MCGNNIDWRALPALQALLSEGQPITLDLSGSPLFDCSNLQWPAPLKFWAAVTAFAEALGSNTTMKRLVLSHCGVTAKVSAVLGKYLVQNKALELLSLSGCLLPLEQIRNGRWQQLSCSHLLAHLLSHFYARNLVCWCSHYVAQTVPLEHSSIDCVFTAPPHTLSLLT